MLYCWMRFWKRVEGSIFWLESIVGFGMRWSLFSCFVAERSLEKYLAVIIGLDASSSYECH